VSLLKFTTSVFPGYQAAFHHRLIAKALQDVEAKKCRRLMVFMPPRHGKSLLVSIHFPAWFLGRNPDQRVLHVSYSSHLSHRFSRATRNLVASGVYQDFFPEVRPAKDSRSVDAWDLEGFRGGFLSAGVGGSITGFGADLVIIDDPIKGAAEANSELVRESLKDWYQQDLRTRLEKNGRIVICQTRWHEDDLSGWLLREMERRGEQWEVLHLPAISEDGEALWPEKFSLEELERIRHSVGSYAWEALYQGRPLPSGGGLLKRKWFRTCLLEHVPPLVQCVLGVDLAVSTRTSADYSVALPLGVDQEGRYWVFRPYRAQAEWPEVRREICQRALGSGVGQIGIEKVAFQSAAIQDLRCEPLLRGIVVREVAADRDKVTRCLEWSPFAEQGRIYLVDDGSGWHEAFLKECESFPRGKHDDQVDALGIAMATLRKVVRSLHFS
jgi:predicted phage terminase large subunit-like protein